MKKTIKNHIFFWSIFFLYVFITDAYVEKLSLGFDLFILLSHDVFIFYASLFLLNKWGKNFKNDIKGILLRIIIVIPIVYILFCLLLYISDFYFLPLFGNTNQKDEFTLLSFFLASKLTWVVQFFSIAFFFSNFQKAIKEEQNNFSILKQNKELQLKAVSLQNAFLRAQINPHFLYNTLNFFYARSLPYSDELANGILTLSEIMRYSLQSQEENGLQIVALSSELNHIENIIKINRLRFKNNLFINYSVSGNTQGISIVPLALITIIENIFKHGEINSPDYPAAVRITIDNTSIQLYCFNKKKGGLKEPSTGIGLDNTKQRLAYTYGSNFGLTTKEEECFFTTELTIVYNPANKI